MELVKTIFGTVKVYKLKSRTDNRGLMTYVYEDGIEGFVSKETRIYDMPRKGTFFGIHYREENEPMYKFVSVIKGSGMDYVIDLRKDSETYLKWESLALSADNALAVLIPEGIGHAFISTEDNTMQAFTIDKTGTEGHSRQLNYKEEKIGLKLPVDVSEISDYDEGAPFLV